MIIWTAFLWGLGASCGATVGLLLLCLLLPLTDLVTGRGRHHKIATDNLADSLAELRRRNDLTVETNAHAARIATALENAAELELRRQK